MVDVFERDGLLCFPSFLSDGHVDRICSDMDAIPEHHRIVIGDGDARHWWGTRSPGFVEARVGGLGGLVSHPSTVALLSAVAFGGGYDFAMHHAHAHVHRAGDLGQEWQCVPACAAS
jgi:hypothetical protein